MALVQEHMWVIGVSVDGVPIQGSFDTFDGGNVTSEASQYRAGGMADPEAMPGPVSTEEVTVGRAYRGERDAPLKKWLNARVGRSAVIGKQALNPDRTPVPGGLETFVGVLSGVSTPTVDSNGDAVAMFELTFQISGIPT